MRIKPAILLAAIFLTLGQVTQAQEDSLSKRVEAVEDEVDGIKEPLQTLLTDVTGLKKIKLTGYMQVRYDYSDRSRSALDNESKNTAISSFGNNFYVRRARLKIAYEPAPLTSKYVFYLNFGRSGFPTVLEAYGQLYKKLKSDGTAVADLTFGQFNVPFGYEIEYSSSKRDFGERSLAEQALFPGERDRGANLNFDFSRNEFSVKFNAAMLQGRGINGTGSTDWQDFTKPKDAIGRVRVNWKNYYVGASYYSGEVYVDPVAFSSTWSDGNRNGVIDSGEVSYVSAKNSNIFEKVRRGVDAQAYFDLIPAGGTAIRAEYFQGFGVGTADTRFLGYYVWLSQQLTTKFGFAYRFDSWDPNTAEAKKGDKVNQHSIVFHHYWDSNTRLSLEYIMPKDETINGSKDKKDNTIRLQSLFVF